MVVVVDDFDSRFVNFGLWWWNDVFFFFLFFGFDGCGRGDGGFCGYDFVVRCLIFFFFFFFPVGFVAMVVVMVVVVAMFWWYGV